MFALCAGWLAPPALAEQALERGNCPEGFVFDRGSGTGCVQENYPPHGRRSYTGTSICEDGYREISERRPTTGTIPGNPSATSFSYLIECVPSAEYDERLSQLEREGGSGAEDQRGAAESDTADEEVVGVAGSLASSASTLSAGQGALLAAVGTGALILAAAPMVRAHPSGPTKPPEPSGETAAQPQPPQPPSGATSSRTDAFGGTPSEASQEVLEELSLEELNRRIEASAKYDEKLAAIIEEYRSKASASRLTPEDYVAFTGLVADTIATLKPGLLTGSASLLAKWLGEIAETTSTRDMDRDIREGLAELARLRGAFHAEHEWLVMVRDKKVSVTDATRDAESSAPPEEPIPVMWVAEDALEAEYEKAQDGVSKAADLLRQTRNAWEQHHDSLTQLNDDIHAAKARLWDSDAAQDGARAETRGITTVNEGASAASASGAVVNEWVEDVSRGVSKAPRGRLFMKAAGSAAEVGSVASTGLSLHQWIGDKSVELSRAELEETIEQLSYDQGRLENETHHLDQRLQRATEEFDTRVARRDELRARWRETQARHRERDFAEWWRHRRDHRTSGRR